MSSAPHPYLDIVLGRAEPRAAEWFERQLIGLAPAGFATAFAGSGRRLGDAPVALDDAERAALSAAGLSLPEGWRLSDVGRSLLLARLVESVPFDEHPELVERVFKKGDNREREALLKCLVMLPEPARFLATAVDSCRSHVQSVFEAIACENPYPARFFPDAAFNQLVLKAFFTGVRVERIVGLEGRRSAELSRMANDYASERRAAGRAVPPDLDLVTFEASRA